MRLTTAGLLLLGVLLIGQSGLSSAGWWSRSEEKTTTTTTTREPTPLKIAEKDPKSLPTTTTELSSTRTTDPFPKTTTTVVPETAATERSNYVREVQRLTTTTTTTKRPPLKTRTTKKTTKYWGDVPTKAPKTTAKWDVPFRYWEKSTPEPSVAVNERINPKKRFDRQHRVTTDTAKPKLPVTHFKWTLTTDEHGLQVWIENRNDSRLPPRTVHCDGTYCVNRTGQMDCVFKCDNIRDCENGEDEENCYNPSQPILPRTTTRSPKVVPPIDLDVYTFVPILPPIKDPNQALNIKKGRNNRRGHVDIVLKKFGRYFHPGALGYISCGDYTHQWIHPSQICDGAINCPNRVDELFCDLLPTICSSKCSNGNTLSRK